MHGHNGEDTINSVPAGGIALMYALLSANSLAAEAMKMDDQIGRSHWDWKPTSSRLVVIR
jgi:hypothetical protein